MLGKLVSGVLFGGALLFGIVTPMEASATKYFACESGFTFQVAKKGDAARCIRPKDWQYYKGDDWPNCPPNLIDENGILAWMGTYVVDKNGKQDLCITTGGYIPVEWFPAICQPGSAYQVEVVGDKDRCRIAIDPVIVPPSVEVDLQP